MKNLCIRFYNDEAGFVVSTELVLVCTVTVLSLCVGLSEVSTGVNHGNSQTRLCVRQP